MRYSQWTDQHLIEPVTGALEAHEGNVTRAARDLGAPLRSLYNLIARLGIDLDEIRAKSAQSGKAATKAD
jgi:DNA-binding NtrC family response regulator